MAKKSKLTKAQDRITETAKAGAADAKEVASDALGAAAAAAAGVVLQRVSQALAPGQEKDAVPAIDPVGSRAKSRRRTTTSQRSGRRNPTTKPLTSRKKSGAKGRTTAKDSKRAAAKQRALKKVARRKG